MEDLLGNEVDRELVAFGVLGRAEIFRMKICQKYEEIIKDIMSCCLKIW
jgi:hypothetical protein